MTKNNSTSASARHAHRRNMSFWRRAAVAVLVLVAAGLGFGLGQTINLGKAATRYSDLKTDFDVTVAQLQYDISRVKAEKGSLTGQLTIENSTRESLEQALQQAQADLAKARERLAFYDQLLPAGPTGTVAIRALKIEPHGDFLTYHVLLVRNGQPGNEFKGHMDFVANGEKNGEDVKIRLGPATGQGTASVDSAQAPDFLQISFEQFQRAEGVLELPAGLHLASVTLNITEGGTVRVSRTIAFPTVP